MIVALLIVAACLPLGSIALDMWREDHRTAPTVVVAKHRAADRAIVASEPLPQRPDGRAALKAEIRQAEDVDVLLVPAPPVNLRVRKERPNWDFDTDHHRAVYANWSDSLPDGLAVQREWVGTGVAR